MLPDAGSPASGRRESNLGRVPSAHAGCDSVLFHPDCDRRLRNRTESADPAVAGARGLMRQPANFTDPRARNAWLGETCKPVRNHRRWGISPRPENVRERGSRRHIISGEPENGTDRWDIRCSRTGAPGAEHGVRRARRRPGRTPPHRSISLADTGRYRFRTGTPTPIRISPRARGAVSASHMKIVSMSRPSMCLPTVSKLVWRPWTCCETAYASRNRRSKAWSSKIAVEPARR